MRFTHHSSRCFPSVEKGEAVKEGSDTRRNTGRRQKHGESSREARQLEDHPPGPRAQISGDLITQ